MASAVGIRLMGKGTGGKQEQWFRGKLRQGALTIQA